MSPSDPSFIQSFLWVIRGNIILPTGNPFLQQNIEQFRDESDRHDREFCEWIGPGLKLLIDHVLTVDKTGRITDVLRYTDFLSEYSLDKLDSHSGDNVVTLQRQDFLCPGMIDLHIHAPQYAYAGTATDRPLMGKDGWLETYTFPAERRLRTDLPYSQEVYSRVVQNTLKHGTTTAVYFATLDVEPCKILVDCALKYGQRALIGKVCMDRNSPEDYCQTLEENVRQTEELIDYIEQSCADEIFISPLVLPLVTPRFIPTCTPSLLSALGDIALKRKCHITSHISESIDEVEFSRFLDETFDCIDGGGRSDAFIFDSHHLLTNQCIMAHGVHLSREDFDLLKLRGTAVAHCPLSNFFFAGGILPCRQLIQRGNRVGLGTDIAGGYNCSILHSARMSVVASQALQQQSNVLQSESNKNEKPIKEQQSTVLDYRHVFYLATMGGAEALNLHDRIGTFAPGMEFDAIILSAEPKNSPVEIFQSNSIADVFQKLVVLGDDRNVTRVFVQGRDVTVT
jgi:guanine deaminase